MKRCLLPFALFLFATLGAAHAGQVVATLVNSTGTVSVEKADGSVQPLRPGYEIEAGDTVVTGKQSYATVRLIDRSEITVRPGSRLKLTSVRPDPPVSR